MGQRTGRKRFDRDTRVVESPGLAKRAGKGGRGEAAPSRVEEAAGRLQNLFAGRPPQRGQIRGDYAGFRRMAGLEWLRHGTEVFPKSSGLAGGNAERPPGALRVEPTQFRQCRDGSKDPDGPG